MTHPGAAQSLGGRLLAAALLAGVGATAVLESRSPLARRLSAGEPVCAWLAADSEAGAALFLAVYRPDRRLAELVYFPPETQVSGRVTVGQLRREALRGGRRGLAASWAAAAALEGALDRPAAGAPAGPPCGRFAIPAAPDGDAAAVALVDRLGAGRDSLDDWRNLGWTLRGSPQAGRLERLRLFLEWSRLDPAAVRLAWAGSAAAVPGLLEGLAAGPSAPRDGPAITAEVLNATDEKGLALRATKVLRSGGVDVLEFRNAPAQPRTLVYDRTGRHEAARKVREVLGCPRAVAATRVSPERLVDVTVILGEDCRAWNSSKS